MISKGTAGDLLDIHSSDKVYILAEVQHSSQTGFQIDTSTETQIIYWDPNHVVESSNGCQVAKMMRAIHTTIMKMSSL